MITTVVSAVSFTFTAIGMTFLVGSITQSRVKGFYNKMTTALTVMNATTESTYIAEILVPLVAFGLPLSPIGLTVGLPLFNAPPVYTTEPGHNLHNLLSPVRTGMYGFIAVLIASAITYPIVMKYARGASAWVMRNIAQEAVLSMFAGLVVVLTYYEGGCRRYSCRRDRRHSWWHSQQSRRFRDLGADDGVFRGAVDCQSLVRSLSVTSPVLDAASR